MSDETKDQGTGKDLVWIRQAANLPAEAWPDERIAAVWNMYGGEAKSASELALFMSTANHYGLDPALREVWLGQIRGKPTVITGRDAFVKVAGRDPEYLGFDSGVVFEKDTFRIVRKGDDVQVEHTIEGMDRGKLVGAYCIAFHKSRRPVMITRTWAQFGHLTGKDVWKQNPDDMIETRCITAALKRQHSLSGLYSPADEQEIEGPLASGPEETIEEAAERLERRRQEIAREKDETDTVVGTRVDGEEVDGEDADYEVVQDEPEAPAAAAEPAKPEPPKEDPAAKKKAEAAAELKRVNADYFRRLNELGTVTKESRGAWQKEHVGKESCTTWELDDYRLAIALLERGNRPDVEAVPIGPILEAVRARAIANPATWQKHEEPGLTISWRIEPDPEHGTVEKVGVKGVPEEELRAELPPELQVASSVEIEGGTVYTLEPVPEPEPDPAPDQEAPPVDSGDDMPF